MGQNEYRRREWMMLAVQARLPAMSLPDVTACKAHCAHLTGPAKDECENDCDGCQMVALVAERLRRALVISFHDVVWGGGDIDPVPDPFALEKAVRERFAKM